MPGLQGQRESFQSLMLICSQNDNFMTFHKNSNVKQTARATFAVFFLLLRKIDLFK